MNIGTTPREPRALRLSTIRTEFTIFIFPVSYGSVEFSGLQILKYCIQQTLLVF